MRRAGARWSWANGLHVREYAAARATGTRLERWPERFKAPVLKPAKGQTFRGFESHSLRQDSTRPLATGASCFSSFSTRDAHPSACCGTTDSWSTTGTPHAAHCGPRTRPPARWAAEMAAPEIAVTSTAPSFTSSSRNGECLPCRVNIATERRARVSATWNNRRSSVDRYPRPALPAKAPGHPHAGSGSCG